MMRLLDLGIEPYDVILDLQRRLVRSRRREGGVGDVLILLEHEPTITLGRKARDEHVLIPWEELRAKGFQVHRVERGGGVTYHGPGQLVGYPILDLTGFRRDVGWYVRSLEEVLIRTLADFGLDAKSRTGDMTGVWIGNAKVAAIGARIRDWVSYHGFALNVDPDMDHFGLIIPCGLRDTEVTSMAEELRRPVAVTEVRPILARRFSEVFETTLEHISWEQVNRHLRCLA